jgi:hypothetical protein
MDSAGIVIKMDLRVGANLFQLVEKLCKKIWPICLLVIYPLWFMWPTILPGTGSMMQYSHILDTSGTVAIVQALDRMQFPWSVNVMANAPIGESFWGLSRMVQSIQWLVLWSLTRFCSAILAVNLFIFIGWVLTGVSIFVLSRYLKLSILSATICGVLVQMLPWVREKAMTHVAYVYLCVPIFAILLLFKVQSTPNRVNFSKLFGYLVLTAFFDLYWFYINIVITFVFLLFSSKLLISAFSKLSSVKKITCLATIPSLVLAMIQLYQYLLDRTSSSVSSNRPFSVASNSFIDIYNGSLLRYINPTTGHLLVEKGLINPPKFSEDFVIYGGAVTVCLAFCAIAFRSMIPLFDRRKLFLVFAVAATCALLTVPTQLTTPFGVFPGPAHFLKFLTPGMRVFSRFGLVTEILICVMAGFAIDLVRKIRVIPAIKYSAVGILLVTSVLDLNPVSRRFVNSGYEGYSEVRKVLQMSAKPVLVELAPDLDKWYFSPNYADAPRLMTANNRLWDKGLMRNAELGDIAFATYLASRQVSHVLVPVNADGSYSYRRKWGVRPSVDLTFPRDLFREVARVEGNFPAALLEVKASGVDAMCLDCPDVMLNWNGVRQGFYSQNSNDDGRFYEDGMDLSWVHANEFPTMTLTDNALGISNYKIEISILAAYGEKAQTQLLRIGSGSDFQSVLIHAGPATRVTLNATEGVPIVFRSFLPCTIPNIIEPGNPDLRKLCYGISGINVARVVISSN